MTMESAPFEDVPPVKNCDVPLPCWFSGSSFAKMDGISTSSSARGGGGSFKKRETIGEIGCCVMSEHKH